MPQSRVSLVGLAVFAFVVGACARTAGAPTVVVDGTPLATEPPTATASAAPAAPTSPASDLEPEHLEGFSYPIANECLPGFDALLPNAPREYRNGTHEGIDWYDGSGCGPVDDSTPVLAMYRGVVVRADLEYRDITADEVAALEARTEAQGFTDEAALDAFRGRQVWVDHGNGIVTRYAHLSRVAASIEVGTWVEAGAVLGTVGESGTPESTLEPGTELHLHAEVRVGDSFLGAGRPPAEVRALYEQLFGASAD